jgi:hypothetical protein
MHIEPLKIMVGVSGFEPPAPGLDQRPLGVGAGLLAMPIVLGPVLSREGGYAFDAWTPEHGLSRGYVYRRVEDAYYARKAAIRSPTKRHPGHIVACSTVDEFVRSTVWAFGMNLGKFRLGS